MVDELERWSRALERAGERLNAVKEGGADTVAYRHAQQDLRVIRQKFEGVFLERYGRLPGAAEYRATELGGDE